MCAVSSARGFFLGAALVLLALSACGGGNHAPDAGPAADAVARAQALLPVDVTLPPRAEVVGLAQAVAAAADREGAGARAAELEVLAARLLERIYRVEGKEQDAKEAIDHLVLASRDRSLPGACDAALRAAFLSGELAHDATATYLELYRADRRLFGKSLDGGVPSRDEPRGAPTGACPERLGAAMTELSAFRPATSVLEGVDLELAGEGAIPGTLPKPLPVQGPPHVTRIEPMAGKEAARVVLTFDRPVQFRVEDDVSGAAPPGAAGRGPRVVVILDGVDHGAVAPRTTVGGILEGIDVEATATGTRVSLALDGRAYRRAFHLLEPFRVVLDVARTPPGGASTTRRVARVVLDPGHGGTDPGAIGPTGVKEKEVTLDIANRAAAVLTKHGISVVLTREDDHFVALEERTARANAASADLFVSIHCNAADRHDKRGIETYVLDTSNDIVAARVASRENATSQAATQELGVILASMRLADQATHSTHLAELMQKAAVASLRAKYTQVHDGGVHNAGFYVLVGARMPAALFETSYISNPVEEQALATEEYRQRLADAVVNAIEAYGRGM